MDAPQNRESTGRLPATSWRFCRRFRAKKSNGWPSMRRRASMRSAKRFAMRATWPTDCLSSRPGSVRIFTEEHGKEISMGVRKERRESSPTSRCCASTGTNRRCVRRAKTELLFIPRSVDRTDHCEQSGRAGVRHELCRDQFGGRFRRAALRSARQAQQGGTRRVRAQCRREAGGRGQGDPQAGRARRPAPLRRAAGRSAHRAQRRAHGYTACHAWTRARSSARRPA